GGGGGGGGGGFSGGGGRAGGPPPAEPWDRGAPPAAVARSGLAWRSARWSWR
ncbi:MAG: peptide-binding protein, partial [Solirubrobacterales bacterium]